MIILLYIAAMIVLIGIFGLGTYLLISAATNFQSGYGLEYLFFAVILCGLDLAMLWIILSVFYTFVAPYFSGR